MRYGRCSNFDDSCPKYVSKEAIALPDGGEFKCPECSRELVAVAQERTLGERVARAPLALKLAAALVPVAAVAVVLMATRARDTRGPLDGPDSSAALGPKPAPNSARTFLGDTALHVAYQDTMAKRVPTPHAPPHADPATSATPTKGVAQTVKPIAAAPPPSSSHPSMQPPSAEVKVAGEPVLSVPPATASATAPTTAPAASEKTAPPVIQAANHPPRTIERSAEVHVRPARNYCMRDLKTNGLMSFVLADAVPLSDGSSVPVGAEVIGRVVAREAADVPDEPDRLRLALTTLTVDGEAIGLSSGQIALQMRRQSVAGKVAKYSIVGAVVGGVGALALHKNPVVGVAIGAGAGAIAGGIAAAAQDPCVDASLTVLPFTLSKEVVLR